MLRENKEEKITAVVEELKDEAVAEAAPKRPKTARHVPAAGHARDSKRTRHEEGRGIVVTNIDVNGPAAEAGLQRRCHPRGEP